MSAIHSQSSSDALIVISANIEGLTYKVSILSELCKDKHCHCLQETHRAKDQARPNIPGMALIVERLHNKHGSSVFVRDGLKINSISVCEEDNGEFITVELPGVVVHSVYKPPAEQFLLPPLGSRNMPHIVIDDFKCKPNTLWGYTSTDNDGEAVELWAESNNLSLIHNAKLQKSFNSAIWNKGYNPDLIYASSNISNMCEKSVLDPIPHTQHRPICVSVNPVIVAQPTTFRRRFNAKKADCEGFSADLDSNIEEVYAIPENYERFVEMLRMASKKHIPRGCRSNNSPGLTDKSKSLYGAYKKQYSIDPFGETTIDTGNTLIDKMKDKKKSWEEVITSTDLTHNSRREWQTIRMLYNDPTTLNPIYLVNGNQVAYQSLINGQGTMPTTPKRLILPPIQEGTPTMSHPLSEEEYKKGYSGAEEQQCSRQK